MVFHRALGMVFKTSRTVVIAKVWVQFREHSLLVIRGELGIYTYDYVSLEIGQSQILITPPSLHG